MVFTVIGSDAIFSKSTPFVVSVKKTTSIGPGMPSPSVSTAFMINSLVTKLYCPSKPDGRLVATTSVTLPEMLNTISSNADVAQCKFETKSAPSTFTPDTG